MSSKTKILCGIILITVPSIQYGGYFLLQVLSGKYPDLELTEFQISMFRAGHAHAGVLIIFSLLAQILSDHAKLGKIFEWTERLGFPSSALLISGGFFAGAIGSGVTEPTRGIALLYVGVFVLAYSLITLGIGLIRNR